MSLTDQERGRMMSRYFWDTRRTTNDPETEGYGYDWDKMYRDLEQAEQNAKDEHYVVGELKKRLDAVRDELTAAKTLWTELHVKIYRIEGEEGVRIPTSIYEGLNNLLGRGVTWTDEGG